jgi:hypothetical protein
MIRTSSLYEACQELFAGYPLADRAVDCGGRTIRSMVLMLREGDDAWFFILTHDRGEGRPSYSFRPWRATSVVDIEADGRAAAPDAVVNAVTHGIPVPRHGSLFGWNDGGIITALTAIYTQYTPQTPLPVFTSMPFADLPEGQWPPYASEPLFGRWFWDSYKAGKVVPLAGLVAETPDTVYWVDTKAILGSASCAVACDIRSPDGPMLRRGRYVYYQALRAGKPVPSLTALLADTGKIDLARRFQ